MRPWHTPVSPVVVCCAAMLLVGEKVVVVVVVVGWGCVAAWDLRQCTHAASLGAALRTQCGLHMPPHPPTQHCGCSAALRPPLLNTRDAHTAPALLLLLLLLRLPPLSPSGQSPSLLNHRALTNTPQGLALKLPDAAPPPQALPRFQRV